MSVYLQRLRKYVLNEIWTNLNKKQREEVALLSGVQITSLSYPCSTGRPNQAVARAFENVSKVPYWKIIGACSPEFSYIPKPWVPGALINVHEQEHQLLMKKDRESIDSSASLSDLDYSDLFQALLLLPPAW